MSSVMPHCGTAGAKMTGETPEIRSDKRKLGEDRQTVTDSQSAFNSQKEMLKILEGSAGSKVAHHDVRSSCRS